MNYDCLHDVLPGQTSDRGRLRTCKWLKRVWTEHRRLRDSAVYWECSHAGSRRQYSRRRSGCRSVERAWQKQATN